MFSYNSQPGGSGRFPTRAGNRSRRGGRPGRRRRRSGPACLCEFTEEMSPTPTKSRRKSPAIAPSVQLACPGVPQQACWMASILDGSVAASQLPQALMRTAPPPPVARPRQRTVSPPRWSSHRRPPARAAARGHPYRLALCVPGRECTQRPHAMSYI